MKPPSERRPVYFEQADFFALLIDELVDATRSGRGVPFSALPEYRRFLHGTYACGFVCRDIDGPAFWERMNELTRRPDELRRADFQTVRRYVHTVMRAERGCDAGGPDGGGVIIDAVRSGALSIIADRLRGEVEWRGE